MRPPNWCTALVWMVWAGAGFAETNAELAERDRIAELERKVEVLTQELSRVKTEVAVPEETPPLESYQGLGPAASKVYGVAQGLSVGGYAEGYYRNNVADAGDTTDQADLLRAVLYVGYKFSENIIFNSEYEFEHATTSTPQEDKSPGSVSVEFLTLDFNWKPELNFRTGLLLIPVGFINEIHEPTTFYGVIRPEVELQIIPTTWRENGAGIFGSFGESLEYKVYVTSGLDALGMTASNIRDARQKGNRELAQDLTVSARVDWYPFEGGLLGASVYTGEVDQGINGLPNSRFTLYEVHAQYRWQGLHTRALFTQTFLSRANDLTLGLRANPDAEIFGTGETIASEMIGGYAEVAYDIMRWLSADSDWFLAPFFRFEYYNTQFQIPSGPQFSRDGADEIKLYTTGLQFKPHPNVVLKLDYRNFNPTKGTKADEVQLGFGLAF